MRIIFLLAIFLFSISAFAGQNMLILSDKKVESPLDIIGECSAKINDNKDLPDCLLRRGIAYEQMERTDDAYADFFLAAKKYNSPEGFFNLGSIDGRRSEFDKAEKNFLKAIELKNDFFESYMNLASIYEVQKKYEKALEFVDKAGNIQPKNPVPFFARGNIYRYLDKPAMAIVQYSKCLEIDNSNPVVFMNRGILYMMTNNKELAINDFLTAHRLSPENDRIIRHIAIYYANEQDYENAALFFGKGFEANPKNPEFLYLRAQMNFELEKYYMAERDLITAIETAPTYLDARYNLGIIYIKTKRNALACQQFDAMCRLGDCSASEKAKEEQICK